MTCSFTNLLMLGTIGRTLCLIIHYTSCMNRKSMTSSYQLESSPPGHFQFDNFLLLEEEQGTYIVLHLDLDVSAVLTIHVHRVSSSDVW